MLLVFLIAFGINFAKETTYCYWVFNEKPTFMKKGVRIELSNNRSLRWTRVINF